MKQYGFVGKTEVLAAASPRTDAPKLPGPMVHRGLAELGSRAVSCPGGSRAPREEHCRRRCPPWREAVGLLLAGDPQQRLPFSTLSVLTSEGVI